MAFAYVFAQCIGAYLGFGLLKYLTPVHVFQPDNSTEIGLCSTVPSADLQPLQAFAIEFLATSVLVLINCGSWNPRNALLQDSFPLKLGFAVATLGCVAVSSFLCNFNQMMNFYEIRFVKYSKSFYRDHIQVPA